MNTISRYAGMLGVCAFAFVIALIMGWATIASAQFMDVDDAATTSEATTTEDTAAQPASTEEGDAQTDTQEDTVVSPPAPALQTEAELRARIAELEAENARLRAQLSGAQAAQNTNIEELTELNVGDSDEAVRELQSLLAAMQNVYPEGIITGYFGPLTEAAVMRFQTQYGLPATGVADPETIVEVLRVSQQGNVPPPPMPTNTSENTNGNTGTNSNAQSGTITLCHIPGGEEVTNGVTIMIDQAELQSHLAHGDVPFPCEAVDAETIQEIRGNDDDAEDIDDDTDENEDDEDDENDEDDDTDDEDDEDDDTDDEDEN